MEPLRSRLSQVRIHENARSAREVGPAAYIVGSRMVFAPGRFAPSTTAGARLLAHELTYVAQQAGRADALLQRDTTAPDPTAAEEAKGARLRSLAAPERRHRGMEDAAADRAELRRDADCRPLSALFSPYADDARHWASPRFEAV